MNRALARFGKALAARAGFRITRTARAGNRFDSMDDVLRALRASGFAPRVVIDAGANTGQWTSLARRSFPLAHFHLIEAQPACAPVLASRFRGPGYHFHPVAITAPGASSVKMLVSASGITTGAAIIERDAAPAGEYAAEVPATTLDALFSDSLFAADRVLLKIDLEGHEIAALLGARRLLPLVEVVVCEVSFYDVNREGRPEFGDVAGFLRENGFKLYDFASLSARDRDNRLRTGDVVFVRRDSALLADVSWT